MSYALPQPRTKTINCLVTAAIALLLGITAAACWIWNALKIEI